MISSKVKSIFLQIKNYKKTERLIPFTKIALETELIDRDI